MRYCKHRKLCSDLVKVAKDYIEILVLALLDICALPFLFKYDILHTVSLCSLSMLCLASLTVAVFRATKLQNLVIATPTNLRLRKRQ